MKNSRHLILVFCGLLLFSCTGNKYIVERTPKHNNPVDEISWLNDNSGSGSGESLPFFFVLKNNSLFFQHKFIGIFPNRELFPKRL